MGKGGKSCSVAICKNTSINAKNRGVVVRFFTFPKDAAIRKEWFVRCHRADAFNPDNGRICSDHFNIEDYEDSMKAKLMNDYPKKLKKTAIPTLLLLPPQPKDEYRRPTKYLERKQRKETIQQMGSLVPKNSSEAVGTKTAKASSNAKMTSPKKRMITTVYQNNRKKNLRQRSRTTASSITANKRNRISKIIRSLKKNKSGRQVSLKPVKLQGSVANHEHDAVPDIESFQTSEHSIGIETVEIKEEPDSFELSQISSQREEYCEEGMTIPCNPYQLCDVGDSIRIKEEPDITNNITFVSNNQKIHVPDFIDCEKMPKGKECKICKKKIITREVCTYCPDCPENPPLCLQACFRQFHGY